MTLTLTPETEATLRAVASQRGLEPEAALAQVLAESRWEFDDTVAGIQRGMDDFAEGRWVSIEQLLDNTDEKPQGGAD